MRCSACNRRLEDFESKKRNDPDGRYDDLCNKCYKSIQADIDGIDKDYYALQHDVLDDDLCQMLGIGE